MRNTLPALIVLAFAVFWLGLMVHLNSLTLGNLARQIRSTSWPRHSAQILESKVREEESDESKSYLPEIHYRYHSPAGWVENDRVRYGFNFTTRAWAQGVVEAHPAGSNTTVAIDPGDPSQVVLLTGTTAGDWQAVVFMLPFDLVGLSLLLLPWCLRTPPSGYPESRRGGRRYLHIAHRNPLLVAGSHLFGWSFGLIFASALLFRMEPPDWFLAAEGVVLVMAPLQAGWLAHRSNHDLSRAVEVDLAGQTISLPGVGRRALVEVSHFSAYDLVGRDSDGDETHTYQLQVEPLQGEVECFHTTKDVRIAERVVAWLHACTDKRPPVASEASIC